MRETGAEEEGIVWQEWKTRVISGIFGLILKSSNRAVRTSAAQAAWRLPKQTYYHQLLSRDPNSLNLTNPSIPEESTVVVLVCSTLSRADVRETIRKTWANPQFSKSVKSKFISVVFLVGTGAIDDVVRSELATSSDILQVDVAESYANLVYKMLAAYRWVHENFPRKFILKMDSDIVALLDKIESIVGNPNEKTVHCHPYTGATADRNSSSPWYIPESAYREYYLPNYCSGPVYLMSPTALAAILRVAPEAKVFEVEDAFFTGVLAAEAGVVIAKIRGIWVEKKESQPCVNSKGTVISFPIHSDIPAHLAEAWNHIRKIRCRYPVEHFVLTFLYDD